MSIRPGALRVEGEGAGSGPARAPEGGRMRTLKLIEFLTLDGVMQGLGSPDEDRDGGFEHGGWAGPYGDQVLMQAAVEGLASTSAYLFGRRTYEKMAAFWPSQPDEN